MIEMKLNEIVLEAPEFGGGRVADARPLDIAQLSEKNANDMAAQDKLLKSFSVQLRQDMLEIAMSSGKKRIEYVKKLQIAATDICAFDLAEKARKFIDNPEDQGKFAKLTHSMVTTSTFLASIRRV